MDCQASTTRSYLERMLFDESIEPKALPLSILKEITNGFSDKQEIGEGGFAIVYKGKLGNGRVAVKKLSKTDIHDKKFTEEVRCLMKVKHKNIVRFLGYCSDTQGEMEEYEGQSVMAEVRERLLCFEYVPGGNLHEYIKDESRDWIKCYQIIRGICEGLHYLHQNHIVHRDIKPANILLNDNMVPKIADFGLSMCFDEKQSQAITSKRVGSVGYLAPEFYNGKITFKSDIFSLGVVIIEILTKGEKGYPNVEDVLERWRNRLEKSQGNALLEQVRVCTEVAQECIDSNPAKRPVMQHIIRRLDDTESTDRCSRTRVSNSTVEKIVNVNECLKDDDITQDMFNEVAGEVVDEVKSMVVHDTSSSPEEMKMDMPHDTGYANSQEPSIVPAEVACEISTSSVSNELIQVDPVEFRFLPKQKEVKSTLKIVNITHEQVAFKFMSSDTTAKYGGVLLPRSVLELAVTRLAEKGAPLDVPRNVVVIVHNTALNEGFMENNITGHMFKTLKGEIVHKVEQGSVHVRPFRQLHRQKFVIIVTMTCDKARSKAMALAARTTGVHSIGITGDGRNQLEVVGRDVDPICLVRCLRKVGHAQLLQFNFVEEETQEKKLEEPNTTRKRHTTRRKRHFFVGQKSMRIACFRRQ